MNSNSLNIDKVNTTLSDALKFNLEARQQLDRALESARQAHDEQLRQLDETYKQTREQAAGHLDAVHSALNNARQILRRDKVIPVNMVEPAGLEDYKPESSVEPLIQLEQARINVNLTLESINKSCIELIAERKHQEDLRYKQWRKESEGRDKEYKRIQELVLRQQRRQRKRRLALLGVAIVVMLLLVFAVGIYYLQQREQDAITSGLAYPTLISSTPTGDTTNSTGAMVLRETETISPTSTSISLDSRTVGEGFAIRSTLVPK